MQEVRLILFSAEEVTTAVTELLISRVRGLGPDQIARVQVSADAEGSARATVEFSKGLNARRVLESGELMTAVLILCRKARIPLSFRSLKRLSIVNGCLAMTTLQGFDQVAPWVEGNTVHYAAACRELAEGLG